jgi:butyrate kinase
LNTPVILVINPGSTSTRTALYEGEVVLAEQELTCSLHELARCTKVADQVGFRTEEVRAFMRDVGRAITDCDAVAARGGPLRPVPGGVYRVNEAMLADAGSEEFLEHVSKLGCVIADCICRGTGVPCFIVDPVSTDEFADLSRLSGLAELPRKCLTHALNVKQAARQYARKLGRPYESLNLITAHMGGGISIAVHCQGQMIDSVDANGEGPFSPERSGGLRADSLARWILQSGRDFSAVRAMLTRQGGLMSHLGTTDARRVEERISRGDSHARRVYEAMAYGVAKHICALAAAVCGELDGILLSGGLARSEMFVEWIRRRVAFLAPVEVYPGGDEMAALRDGVARAVAGEEAVRVYSTGEAERAE